MQANSAVQVSGASGTAASTNIEALTAARVSSAPLADVLRLTDTTVEGLSDAEASTRLVRYGPNSVRTHRVSAIAVLGRQLRSAVLGLLAATAVLSFFLGDSKQAIIIGIILAVSIGLGFVNEYRAERASAALYSAVSHTAVVRRDGRFDRVDVNHLVPGRRDPADARRSGACRRAAGRCQRSGMQRKHLVWRIRRLPKIATAGQRRCRPD